MDAASAKARGERAAPAPLPAALGRNAPLVPVDSAASRALVGVIAILPSSPRSAPARPSSSAPPLRNGNPRSSAR